MSIPATWGWFGGGTPSKDNPRYWNGGSIPWVSPKDMKVSRILDTEDHITEEAIRNSATSVVPDGAVLMVTRSGILQHTFPVAVAGVDATLNQDLKALVPFDGLDSNYLAAALRAFGDQVLSKCSKHGTTVQSIEFSRLKDFEIPIAPLNEQERIVAKVDELFSELDAGVASLKRARALLKKYRQAVLKAAVTGELTRDWRERHQGEIRESGAELLQRILKARRQAWEAAELKKLRAKGKPPKDDHWKQKYKEPQPPDTAGLPDLPEGWVWVSLDQLIILVTSGSRGWKDYYANSGSLFIRAQNLKDDALDLSDAAYVDLPGRTEGVRTRVMEDDILVTITGANVTKSALVNLSLPEAYVSQHVGLARLAIRDCARFVHSWIICASLGRKYLLGAAYGAGKPGLNLDNLRDLVLALPPLEEQHEVNTRVDEVFSNLDSMKLEISIQLNHSGSLRQSILNAAFSGKLVPQDPNDEPAGVLLERIRAGRAARPRSTRGRRRKAASRQLELLE